MKVLRSRVYELERSRLDAERAEDRKGQVGSGDRSERIRTYNFPQARDGSQDQPHSLQAGPGRRRRRT